MHSAIFKGQVKHRRMRPVEHAFHYRLFMVYLDLAELDTAFKGRWLWSARRPALARFRREDHLGDPAVPLDEAVRSLVAESGAARPQGPIRLLTHLRYFGYCFNPVSFYYCFDQADEQVETIVAEVNNTPWGERHCYVLGPGQDAGQFGHHRYHPRKAMHVSPFMEMDVDYDWRFNSPRRRLAVYMQNRRKGDKVFDATLDLHRQEISSAALASALTLYPFMTARVIFAIHWQALKLWIKGAPVHDHPGNNASGKPGDDAYQESSQ
jgi:DUF1365 family protein